MVAWWLKGGLYGWESITIHFHSLESRYPPGEYGEDSERRISGRSVFMPEFMQVDRVLPLLHMV